MTNRYGSIRCGGKKTTIAVGHILLVIIYQEHSLNQKRGTQV